MEQNKHSELKQRRHGLYGQLIVDKTIKNTYWVKVSLRNGYRKTICVYKEFRLLSHTIPNNSTGAKS